jgi:hypothetical protein
VPLRELPYERLEPLLRDHISTDEDLPTAELIRELRPARARGYLTKAELQAVCRWKSPRAIHRIRSNTARRVRSAVTGTTGASLFAGITMRKATLDPGAAARFAPPDGQAVCF